jgi:hypothetical protein
MSASDLAARVRDLLAVDRDAFAEHVERETEDLKAEIDAGTFDNPQAIVGLEYEFFGVDSETSALKRVPRRLLEFIGFEKELGLHNAEMTTSPQPLSKYGLRAQEAEVQANLDAALTETNHSDIRLVSDGMWTLPPVGETAREYLTDSIVQDGVRIASNMSDAPRYHAMANAEFPAGMTLEAPHVHLDAETVMPESLITSIQPHYQVPHADDLPEHMRYALRIAGPLLALGVNSPFFPPDLYDDAVAPEAIIRDAHMESRVDVFESVLNPPEEPKVCFPEDVATVEEAVDRIAADRTVVPTRVEGEGRFDDRFGHLRHKHGTFWRWVRPVFDGATRSAANARIEFRPLPAQPTVRDTVALQATFAGLLESLPRREHPVGGLEWERARENFYAAVEDGLRADLVWTTADGTTTRDRAVVFGELFDHARDGLTLRGLSDAEADRYLDPLCARVDAGVTPARWKHERVRNAVDAGVPFAEAVWGAQVAYVRQQSSTLIEGSFADWLDYSPE